MTYPMNLVSPAWLAAHLDDKRVVVADCRFALANPSQGRQHYQTAHIPGAYYLDLNQDLSNPAQPHGGRHPLPDIQRFSQRLTAMGVTSAAQGDADVAPTWVVAYDDSRFAFAARLWWLLKYLGHDRVAVLDGGWQGWVQAGYPVSQDGPRPKTGQFVPCPKPAMVVDRHGVSHSKDSPGILLIDSRSPERYRGDVEPIDPVAGHIPGATNYFWQDVSSPGGWMRSPTDLAQHWAGLDVAQSVMVYCGSGVTACVNLLAQTLAGKPMGQLYVGGWSDWCTSPEYEPR